MRTVPTKAWLAAAAFAVVTGVEVLTLYGWRADTNWVLVAVAVGITGAAAVPIWWWVVARWERPGHGPPEARAQPRYRPAVQRLLRLCLGVFSGVVCGAAWLLVFALILAGNSVWQHPDRAQPQADDESVRSGITLAFVVGLFLPLAAGIGAVVGAAVAVGVLRIEHPPPAPPPAAPPDPWLPPSAAEIARVVRGDAPPPPGPPPNQVPPPRTDRG